MKHMRGLVSTTQALRQTFLPPLQTSQTPFLRYSLIQNQTQSRLYQSRRQPPANPLAQRQIRDEEIRAEFIQLVNEEGSLDAPEKLRDVLRTLERPEHYIIQVSPGSRDRPPVCKIVNRQVMREQERAKTKAAQAAKSSVKQIELNWAIDPHDLSHRMKQLTTFLDKGRRVEIVLIRKKGKRAPTVDEIKNVMDTVMETTKAANAMQVKPMEGELGKFIKVVVKKKDT
ncbi:hypothetical protein ASPWEDRAFT_172097 [Aspergillus wentii DTO 134E9]|uniref:Translation initiation factor 3 N-terminal domain-containing protein n=1 Tax=Aspergillus wentii DTO 134E9 TaxID=1073089 RepID=A0A1L9RKA5_ASPWE|nr:uncharacterized protein ASPWEDRAFT_172097 [Aspergillus wentii DTO 134E9]KAI9923586.1 hypothetical protein MW887_008508 [Aspergillus wentii]OJJ35277.1 hypothetical protein ASPWEDRAFT_172097 [Aspergillus wentii DTO 134E9]